MANKKNGKIRYNIVIVLIYLVGAILLWRLFDLQIVHGEEYREISNTRLTRETTLKAARGDILDSSGNKLVTTTISYNVEIYRTKIDSTALNDTLLLLALTLEQNGDRYVDHFPILVGEKYEFKPSITPENWKKANEIDEWLDAEGCFNYYKERYKVTTEDPVLARKIITLRYAIEEEGYSTTKSVELATDISQASYAKLNEMSSSFPGINTTTVPKVTYPYGELASHILGYVAPINSDELETHPDYDQNDQIGRAGIEQVFEKYLKGKDGLLEIEMSVDGVVQDEYIKEQAQEGNNVVLTIDAKLQQATEAALAEGISVLQEQRNGLTGATGASEGAAVVINVRTGEVLAMASFPNYNPALFIDGISQANYDRYINDQRHPFINKAISDLSAPGSTFKMVTALAGLESEAINLTTKIHDTGRYTYYDDYQPWCWASSGHGWLNVVEAIEHSCNYFFYETGRLAGIDKIDDVAGRFGLGQKTGIELPEEDAGVLSGKAVDEEWTGGKTIQTAIGQLYNNFTPLQMCKYTAMIANGGSNLDVSIIKAIQKPDGTQVSRNEIDEFVNSSLNISGNSGQDLNIKPEYLDAVKAGMRGVTSDDAGTASYYFRGFNIELAGKTGSASIDSYGHANAWFVGYAPYDNPEIAVAVFVKNGQKGGYTAPIAREIFAQYFGMNEQAIHEDLSATSKTLSIR